MKKFHIPQYYRSPLITDIKNFRRSQDQKKKDYTPTVLDFGHVRFLIARHFGFCYGVENAIEISYRAIEENPGKKIYLLSEMIHNPDVNGDLLSRGVKFIMDTGGKPLIPWDALKKEDVILVPAFGTTIEIEQKLQDIGIHSYTYDTTCPFVEKVWNKAAVIGKQDYTIVIHGKPSHEETRATFSHSRQNAPTMVVRDMKEAEILGRIILGELPYSDFFLNFKDQFSAKFDPALNLDRIGVVNQTTMLASDTQAIADYLRTVMMKKFQLDETKIKEHFADTGDTLCYATNDNQSATYGLLNESADLAIVAGGYNSSNTAHLVELCEGKLPTYLISSADKILAHDAITHFLHHAKKEIVTSPFLPSKEKVTIMLTSGASCPDTIVENILKKIVSYFPNSKPLDEVAQAFRVEA